MQPGKGGQSALTMGHGIVTVEGDAIKDSTSIVSDKKT